MNASLHTIHQNLQDNKQNCFVAMAVDCACQGVKWCIENNLTVLNVEVGKYNRSVITIQDAPSSKVLQPHACTTRPDADTGQTLSSITYLQCVIQWPSH